MSREVPNDAPLIVARQPSLWLCPSTSQNGFPGCAPLTETVEDTGPLAVTRVVGTAESVALTVGGATAPEAVSAAGPPPASEANTNRSRSMPLFRPWAAR